jgi:hypothetical protein
MKLKPGPAILTDYALDAFIAPELSKLGRPDLPSLETLAEQAKTWLQDFLLSHMLVYSSEPRDRQYRFGFVRRAISAVEEYEFGRRALNEYIQQPLRQRVGPYFRALRHLEAAVAGAYQAVALGSTLAAPGKPFFEKKHKSEFARLERIYVHSRHAHELFDSQQVPRDLTLTLWLTADGLKCVQGVLSYTELADILSMLGRLSTLIANPTTAPPPPTGSDSPSAA